MINKGEITAFLSMIILLILALVGTILESARVNVARTYIDRALTTSMDNVFSEYYYPLYEDYHLFLLDGGYGTEMIKEDKMIEKMKENMKVTFQPEMEINLLGQMVSVPNTDFFDISVEHIQINDITNVTDYDNKPFIHEATAYMKYQMPAKLIENAANGLSFLKDSGQSSEVIEKKLKLEASLSVLGEGMLDLICQIEGIKVGKKGVSYNKSGLITTEKDFVKKICIREVNQETVNISKDIVWNSLKDKYQNPIPLLDNLLEQSEIMETCYVEMKALREELNYLRGENPEDTKEERVNIYKEIERVNKQQQVAQENVKELKKQLKSLISGTKSKIENALDTIDRIEKKRITLEKETREYEEVIKKNKKDIPEEIYKSLETDLVSQKEFLKGQQEKKEYNLSPNKLQVMRDVLSSNMERLIITEEIIGVSISGNEKSVEKMKTTIITSKTALGQYNIRDLNFDYSSFKAEANVKNPLDNYSKLIKNGILNLVVDQTQNISMNEITSQDLPSYQISGSEEKRDKSRELSNDIKECEEGYQDEISHSFSNYAEVENSQRESTSEGILGKILFEEYLLEHFKNYVNNEKREITRDSILNYEQEYLIAGEKSDYDNFNNVIYKLAFSRTIINYLYLITDKVKCDTAYAVAATIVGFTCIEPLISLTKTVILLIWAYEESLVDIRGLLEGKYISFFKTKDTFKIKFEELFLISKNLIKEKAEGFPTERIQIKDMNYEDYIRILLFLTNQKQKSLRALDLIQENMNNFYEGEFKVEQCIFGYKVKADFNIGTKFIKLPFIQNILGANAEGYSCRSIKENSY